MDNFPVVSQPKRMKVSLYPHQLTSIFRMEELERNQRISVNNLEEIKTRIGILSDLTGYGKTLSILGLIERDNMEVKEGEYFINKNKKGNSLVFSKKVNLYTNISSNLIVLNSSLLTQWEQELQKTDLTYTLINSKKGIEDLVPEKYEVILCNQSMFPTLLSRFRKFCWKRLIIDEPQTLKIQDWNNFAFHFIWLVTATPYALLMDKKNVNGMFQELFSEEEDLFSKVIIRNPDNYVKHSFLMPENIHYHYHSYNPINQLLEGIVSPVLLELISAGNIREAIKFLGGDVQNPESLYLLVKNKKLEKLKEIDIQINIILGTKEDSDKIKKLEERKKVISDQIKNLEDKLEEMLNENCFVCNEKLENPLFLSCCQNILCGKCILTWMEKKDNCILCRTKIEKDNLIFIQTSSEVKEEKKEFIPKFKFTKPQIIQKIVKDRLDGKFIIFSNYDESFETIKRLFDEDNIKYSEIKGGKDSRSKSIHSYKYEDCQVLFLNSKNNGSGINLEETTDIILYHPMNDFSQTQILGRANRIGRTNTLNVHHLN